MRLFATLLAVTMPAAALNPGVALGIDLGTSGLTAAQQGMARLAQQHAYATMQRSSRVGEQIGVPLIPMPSLPGSAPLSRVRWGAPLRR